MALIVLGLDGATWDLIEPWIEDGALPNIRMIREEGIWGISRSVLPPVTCPNWKCYSTSRSPDVHDVYWWEVVDKNTLEMEIPDAHSFSAPEVWDYLDDAGYDAGVMNLPMSYPPKAHDPFLISGGPPAHETGYTYPETLESTIEQRHNYRVHPETLVTDQSSKGVDSILGLIKTRFDTAEALLAEYDLDFLNLTIWYLNTLQHHFWNGEPVKRAWKLIDDRIGTLLEEGHTLFLMSDHGCSEIQSVFYVNEWLDREGYLTLGRTMSDYLRKLGITHEKMDQLARTFHLRATLRGVLPTSLIHQFPQNEGIKRKGKFSKMKTDESVAIGSGQGLIYVLEPERSEAYSRIQVEIMEKLAKMETPHGTSLIKDVHRGSDLYPKADPKYRPDVVFEQGGGVHTDDAVEHGQVFDEPGQWRAENVPEGLFLAHGENVRGEGEIDPISILDIAPSILYALGEPIPHDFEGTPVRATNTSAGEPTYRQSFDDAKADKTGAGEEVRERLTDIGYLS